MSTIISSDVEESYKETKTNKNNMNDFLFYGDRENDNLTKYDLYDTVLYFTTEKAVHMSFISFSFYALLIFTIDLIKPTIVMINIEGM